MKDRPTIVLFSFLIALLLAACQAATTEDSATPEPQSAAQQEPAPMKPTPEDLLRNGVLVEEGVLAGGQPTEQQLAALAEAGYRTVINMRLPDEEGSTDPEAVEALGMSYVTVPVEGAAGLSEERTVAFAQAMAEAERPLIVHCGSGNRVGALFALKAFYVDGMSVDDSVRIGLETGMTGLESAVREHLAAAAEPVADS